jgi:hypothetical protein
MGAVASKCASRFGKTTLIDLIYRPAIIEGSDKIGVMLAGKLEDIGT